MNDALISRKKAVAVVKMMARLCRDAAEGKNDITKDILRDVEDILEHTAMAIEKIEPEMQKPIPFERISDGPVFVEFKGQEALRVGLFYPDDQTYGGMIMYKQFGVQMRTYVEIGKFGRYWRCWEKPPTLEEREAAQWEDEE